MEGEITINSSTQGDTNLFTLKSGFRPGRKIVFYVIDSNGKTQRLQIDIDGIVKCTTNNTDIVNISISSLHFIVA